MRILGFVLGMCVAITGHAQSLQDRINQVVDATNRHSRYQHQVDGMGVRSATATGHIITVEYDIGVHSWNVLRELARAELSLGEWQANSLIAVAMNLCHSPMQRDLILDGVTFDWVWRTSDGLVIYDALISRCPSE